MAFDRPQHTWLAVIASCAVMMAHCARPERHDDHRAQRVELIDTTPRHRAITITASDSVDAHWGVWDLYTREPFHLERRGKLFLLRATYGIVDTLSRTEWHAERASDLRAIDSSL